MVRQSYVITRDVRETLQNRLGVPMTPQLVDDIHELEGRFVNEYWNLIDQDDEPVLLTHDEIVDPTKEAASKSNRLLVSLDDVFFPDNQYEQFSITRLTDPHPPFENHKGPRPGHPPFVEQLKALQERYDGQEVAIVDVGVWSGETIEGLKDPFAQAGFPIKEMYVGLAGQDAQGIMQGMGIDLSVAHEYNFDEWIELRDVIGIDGRKIDPTQLHGLEHMAGRRLFIPYRENPGWATISDENAAAFVDLCDGAYDELEQIMIRARVPVSRELVAEDGRKIYELKLPTSD